jgi:GT2 family glycosyltransferase
LLSQQRSEMKKVAIVILNYNGGDLLIDCINSFLELKEAYFQLIVVDNDSTDGSIQKAERIDSGGRLKIIHTGQNLGYTGGNNVGIEYALEKEFDYVLLVNADTIVINPFFLKEMVQFAEKDPRVAIIGPKVYFREKEIVQNTICALPFFIPTLKSWLFNRLSSKNKIRSGNKIKEVDVLNGVCILIKRSFLEKVGAFDFDIFMYREDTDLALRAKKHGWKSIYLPTSSILHLQKTEGYEYTSMVNFLLKRNAVYVLKKHGRYFDAYAYAISSLFLSFLRILKNYRRKEKYRTFLRLLASSYWVILTNKNIPDNKQFGPPYNSWKTMTQ